LNHIISNGVYLDDETEYCYSNQGYYNSDISQYIIVKNSIERIVSALSSDKSNHKSSSKYSEISNSTYQIPLRIDYNFPNYQKESNDYPIADVPESNNKSSFFGNSYIAISQTSSIISTVIKSVGDISKASLNALTTVTIRLNSIGGNINVTRMGTLGTQVSKVLSKISVGILIVSAAFQVIDNFTNSDYSLTDKIGFSAIVVGITYGVYLLASSVGGLPGIAVASVAFVAFEVFDVDTYIKKFVKNIFGW